MFFKKFSLQEIFLKNSFQELYLERNFAGIAAQTWLDRRISAEGNHWPNLPSRREGIRARKDR
jgi:hypothetical protein